jgi:NitT/TauT family transport system permease protein
MLLVRQPIPRVVHVILGVLSVCLLIGAYTWLANSRQQAKRNEAADKSQRVQRDLEKVNAQIVAMEAQVETRDSSASPEVRALHGNRERLQQQLAVLERESQTALDRTVPTLSSLYHDGLLRVLKPQGLRKDEYWLWEDTIATFKRLIAGMALGVLLSVALGILMGAYTPVEAFFVPPLSFLAKIPPTAMLAVFFVLVGTTFKMYVTMIAFGTLPTLAQTVYQSARKDVPASLVFKAYTLGASHAELIWNVIYKQILPRLIDAVRLQIGPAMVLLVAAEWMVAGEGFGYRLRLFYQRTDMTVVYFYLLLLGWAGLVVDYALIWFRRWLCPWFGE